MANLVSFMPTIHTCLHFWITLKQTHGTYKMHTSINTSVCISKSRVLFFKPWQHYYSYKYLQQFPSITNYPTHVCIFLIVFLQLICLNEDLNMDNIQHLVDIFLKSLSSYRVPVFSILCSLFGDETESVVPQRLSHSGFC